MENEDLLNYIKSLKEYEKSLNEDKSDSSTLDGLNDILGKLNDAVSSQYKPVINDMMVNVMKLHEDAVIPSYSKPGDAGLDLTITDIKPTTDVNTVSYGFGLAFEIPEGYVGLIFPRSSVRKYDLILSNCVGVVDSGYRGEIMATFKKTHNRLKSYGIGERAAQILILPYPKIQLVEKKELTKTDRNDGGFGHTGN